MNRTLVIGCGNTLRSDDGVGWRVIEGLRGRNSRSNMMLEAVQQLTPELAEDISQADTVIFVDASVDDQRVVVRRIDAVESASARFTHSVTPAALLSLSRQLYGRGPTEAFLVTIGATSFQFSENASQSTLPCIREAVEVVCAIAKS